MIHHVTYDPLYKEYYLCKMDCIFKEREAVVGSISITKAQEESIWPEDDWKTNGGKQISGSSVQEKLSLKQRERINIMIDAYKLLSP
jgi:hypothetical protein